MSRTVPKKTNTSSGQGNFSYGYQCWLQFKADLRLFQLRLQTIFAICASHSDAHTHLSRLNWKQLCPNVVDGNQRWKTPWVEAVINLESALHVFHIFTHSGRLWILLYSAATSPLAQRANFKYETIKRLDSAWLSILEWRWEFGLLSIIFHVCFYRRKRSYTDAGKITVLPFEWPCFL